MARKRAPKSSGDQSSTRKVADILRHVNSYFSVTESVRREMKEDLDFVIGGRRQWKEHDITKLENDPDGARPVLSMNKVQPVVNFITGLQGEREVDYRYFPRGTEDEQFGRILTSNVKYIMDRTGGMHEEGTQFRQGYITGASVLEVGHGYDYTDDLIEGDVTLTSLAMNSAYCDVLARRYDRCDGRYMGKLMWYNEDDAASKWPDAASRIIGMGDWFQYDPLRTGVGEHLLNELYDKETGRVRVLQHWYKVPVTAVLIVNLMEPDPAKAIMRVKNGQEAEDFLRSVRDRAGVAAVAPFKVIETDTLQAIVNQQTGGIMPITSAEEGDRFIEQVRADAGNEAAAQYDVIRREATALRVCHLTGAELLSDEPSPYDDDWRFPFSWFFCFNDGENFGDIKGGVRDLKDPQREINWHHATIIDTMQRAPKGATWVDTAMVGNDPARLNDLRRKLPRPGFLGTYTGTPPTYWPPGSFSPGDLAMMEIGADFISTISGADNLQANPQQKTVSGRAIGARFAGGVVSLGTVFKHWQRTKEYTGMLLAKRAQQFHSPEKMARILGQEFRLMELAGLDMKMVKPPEMLYEELRRVKELSFDVVVGFQDVSSTAREANLNRLLQFMGIGIPVPGEFVVESSDVPYKEEIKAALSKQGMQQPNPDLLKAVGAMQGQGVDGVNKE